MAGSWLDDTYPIQSVFGRTGAVVSQSGDYSAGQIAFDSGLAIANPANVGAALDALYDFSPLGDKPYRVITEDFHSALYVNGTTPTVVADSATIGSGASNSALGTGTWSWTGSAAASDLLREVPPASSSMSGVWTIRSSGTATGLIATRAELFTSVHRKVSFKARVQILPVAQTCRVGFFNTIFTDYAFVEFNTLSSSVFTIQIKCAKGSVLATSTVGYTSVNQVMTVSCTLADFGTKLRFAIFDAIGNLVGPVQEYGIAAANQIATASSTRAGVFTQASSNPANTPLTRVDYCELGFWQ
jgi:hypothetical protein